MKANIRKQYVSRCLFILVLLIAFLPKISAQESITPVQLHLEGRYDGQQVTLRWGFAPVQAWRYLNHQGYILERYELDAQNQPVSKGLIALTPSPIKPWSKSVWEQQKNNLDTFALIAAQCLLGKNTEQGDSGSFFQQLDMLAQESGNRASLALLSADISSIAAEALGLRWTDSDIRPNRKYVYQLRVQNSPGGEFTADTALFIISTDTPGALPIIAEPELMSGDLLLTLKWPAYKVFTAYHVERSIDGINWENRTKKPYIRMLKEKGADADYIEWADPIDTYDQEYFYRIKGVDGFGIWSPYSPVVSAKSAPPGLVSSAKITMCSTNDKNEVLLEWSIDDLTKIKGFVIGHSQSVSGPWVAIHEELIPAATKSWKHKAEEHERNFYRIWTVDIYDQTASSEVSYAIMKNSAPPSAPEWLGGNIDSSGLVTLKWKRNKETDLQGYQLYYAHQEDHIPLPLQSDLLTDTTYSFTISLQNLSSKVWFYLKAADTYLAVSDLSKALVLEKPDKMPPVAAVIKDYHVRDTALFITWIPSSSDDLKSQQLMRRTKGKEWQILATFGETVSSYTDTEITAATLYEYVIRSADTEGWMSSSESIVLRSLPFAKIEAVKSLAVRKSKAGKEIELSWDYQSKKDLQFRLFTINDQGALEILAEVPADSRSFVVAENVSQSSTGFAIRVVPSAGVPSAITRAKKI